MHKTMRRLATAGGLALLFAAAATSAQETVRIRGTLERVDGQTLLVKARDGTELKVVPAANAVFVAMVKASFADIKRGSFVGATAMPQPDGSQKAVEVHIFPESMRGSGEGHRPWDLQPQSTMTNANVDEAVTGIDGTTLTLKYKDGEKKVIVPPGTPIVSYVMGSKSELTPGTKIFIPAATKQADGTLETARVNYGRDGLTPPM
jgi:outer membrane lipoprotein SlyB